MWYRNLLQSTRTVEHYCHAHHLYSRASLHRQRNKWKSSSISITRCTHTCCAHSSSQVCEKRAQDCSWWHKRRRCREVTPPVTTVTLLDSRLTTPSSRLADKALSGSLSFSLCPPFTPATWSCVKGLRKARLGTNIMRDRDIARGCGMECDREKAVAEGGTEARERLGGSAQVRSECEWHCINSLSHLLLAGVHQLSTLLTSLTHKHSTGLLHTYTYTRRCLKLIPGLSSTLQKRWQKRMSSKCAAGSYARSIWRSKDNVLSSSAPSAPSPRHKQTHRLHHTHQYVCKTGEHLQECFDLHVINKWKGLVRLLHHNLQTEAMTEVSWVKSCNSHGG